METYFVLSVSDRDGRMKESDVCHKDVLFQIAFIQTGSSNWPIAVFRQLATGQITQTSRIKSITTDYDKAKTTIETQNSVYVLQKFDYTNAIEV